MPFYQRRFFDLNFILNAIGFHAEVNTLFHMTYGIEVTFENIDLVFEAHAEA